MNNEQAIKDSSIPFKYILDTFIAIPMTVNGSITGTFILDTGIGVNLLSRKLCEQLGCHPTHEHVGHRMSGQELKVPMTRISSLSIGNVTRENVAVGLFDMESLMPGENVIGFIGLDFFETIPFTVDYEQKNIILESLESMERVIAKGHVASVALDRKDDALSIMLNMVLPTGREISVEVDSGSQALILDEKFMDELKIREGDPNVKKKDGQDETGHKFTRYFAQLDGAVQVRDLPEIREPSPKVMFQKIIYDGLVGHNFLSRFTVTFDLPHSRMIFR